MKYSFHCWLICVCVIILLGRCWVAVAQSHHSPRVWNAFQFIGFTLVKSKSLPSCQTGAHTSPERCKSPHTLMTISHTPDALQQSSVLLCRLGNPMWNNTSSTIYHLFPKILPCIQDSTSYRDGVQLHQLLSNVSSSHPSKPKS